MAALALGVALGALSAALGGFLVAAIARRGSAGPKLAVPGKAVAHRGGAGERIENTMEAFEHAVSEGCDWLELDVRRTRDGVVVVCHDRDLSRQSGRHLDVTQIDYKDLPPYRSPLEVTFSPGSFSSGCDRRIPRLVDVFQRFPRQPMSIEVKDDDDDLIHEVASLVRRFDRAPITLWASFRERILSKCRRAVSPSPTPGPSPTPTSPPGPSPTSTGRSAGGGGDLERVCGGGGAAMAAPGADPWDLGVIGGYFLLVMAVGSG
ncbi:lysophospholipase D GDPD3-like [Passerculus sandwichensis]